MEAELGHVGDNEGDSALERPEDYYTDPDMAKDFTDRTGVDALAIAVGTAHGLYKFKPKLDFERITKIKNAIGIPLVLHGGSGLSGTDFQTAIAHGISKINIFTDINIAAASAAAKATRRAWRAWSLAAKRMKLPRDWKAFLAAVIRPAQIS